MLKKYKNLFIAGLLSASLLALSTFPTQANASTSVTRSVAGWMPYWNQTQAFSIVQNNPDIFDELSPCWYDLGSSGELVALPNSENSTIVSYAPKNGKKLIPLISNEFNATLLSTIINSHTLVQSHINNIVNKVVSMGYTGIDIDYENVLATDKTAFTGFIQNLALALHAKGKVLVVTVHPKTSDNSSWNGPGGQDYAALGQAADKVRIMAYDYHWNTSAPGSIAPASWVDQVVSYAITAIPANKVVLGVPDYGYDWPAGGTGKGVSYAQAMATATTYGAVIIEGAQNGPSYTYTVNGVSHTVWFENANFVSSLLDIVNKYNINGIAIWHLGGEDANIYPAVRTKFVIPSTGSTTTTSTGTTSGSNTTTSTTSILTNSSLAVAFNCQEYKSSMKINANLTNNVPVTKVEFYVDGKLLATDIAEPYAAYCKAKHTNTNHPVIVTAYDSTGNKVAVSKPVLEGTLSRSLARRPNVRHPRNIFVLFLNVVQSNAERKQQL